MKAFHLTSPDIRQFYEHLSKLSVSKGLWFCVPIEGSQKYFGWVIPPFTIHKDFRIKANGLLCQVEPLSSIPRGTQDIFDRFGIGAQSGNYVFNFSLPPITDTNEVVLTCQFAGEFPSVFYSYFKLDIPHIATPASNMMRVANSDDFGYFTLMGYTQYRHIKSIIEQYVFNTPTLLDWGCGSARVLRYFALNPEFRIVGVDVDAYNIDWCQQVFGNQADFHLIQPTEPCPFPDSSFDVIYGISIFTHLGRDSERFWLTELRRLLKPGGLAVMTVHGELAFFKSVNDLRTYSRLIKEGFLDVGACSDLRVEGKETLSEELYRNVFHTRSYIEAEWGQYFRIVDYIPGGSTAHQDYVILIRE